MTEDDYDTFAEATQAMVKRIAAENTWLRHSLMELEARVTAMTKQVMQLEAKAKDVRQALRLPDGITSPAAARIKKITQRRVAAQPNAAREQPTPTRSKQ